MTELFSEFIGQHTSSCGKSVFRAGVSTQRLKAVAESEPVIAAVNRCATQKQAGMVPAGSFSADSKSGTRIVDVFQSCLVSRWHIETALHQK